MLKYAPRESQLPSLEVSRYKLGQILARKLYRRCICGTEDKSGLGEVVEAVFPAVVLCDSDF